MQFWHVLLFAALAFGMFVLLSGASLTAIDAYLGVEIVLFTVLVAPWFLLAGGVPFGVDGGRVGWLRHGIPLGNYLMATVTIMGRTVATASGGLATVALIDPSWAVGVKAVTGCFFFGFIVAALTSWRGLGNRLLRRNGFNSVPQAPLPFSGVSDSSLTKLDLVLLFAGLASLGIATDPSAPLPATLAWCAVFVVAVAPAILMATTLVAIDFINRIDPPTEVRP